jgi:hypothetical protein
MASAAAQSSEKALVPSNATAQVSYSGTPRGPDGTTQPDDYVFELANPVRRMEIFEEMGQGDDAVHTGIAARRQEILAANWQLSTEGTAANKTEILEFVEDNIYPILDDVLRWLGGGALQYGVGVMEPVYQWSTAPIVASISRGKVKRAVRRGDEKIYVRKLAHIRQTGIETFIIAGPTDTAALAGDLLTVRQHVFDGASFRRREIPAEKLVMWTYDRQGDDYWGVPPARHCYKGWKFKQQLERLNLLHNDKFSVGTPVVVEPEGGYTDAERTRTANFLRAWRSTSDNFLIVPNGSTVEIVSDDGKTSMSMLEWVKYYNLTIAKTYLTQQTELGSTETGARALGEVFYDQMGGIVQADCEALANLINNTLIVPLVNWNFGEQEFYPTFAPSQRVRAGSGVATVIAQLIGAKAIHPRPEDEAYLRDIFEMPAVEVKTLKAEQDARDAIAQTITDATKADPSADPQSPAAKPGTGEPKPPLKIAADRPRVRVKQLGQMADGAPTPAKNYETTYRTPEYAAWEHGILRPDVLSRDLDAAVTRAADEVRVVLRTIDDALTEQVQKLAAKGAAALRAGIKSIAVSDRLRTELRKVLFAAAQRARDYGGESVVNEIDRQLGPSAIGPQRAPYVEMFGNQLRYATGNAEETPEDLQIGAEVDNAVEQEIDRREQGARSAALDTLRQAVRETGDVLATIVTTAAKSALIGLSTGRTADNVEGVINVGFGVGRSETAQQIQDDAAGGGDGGSRSGLRDAQGAPIDLVAKVASAVMDLGTCDECAKWDGAEFPIDYPEDYTGVQCPNPRCAGTITRCRCVWIYLTSKESVPLVPASKGPEPIRRVA